MQLEERLRCCKSPLSSMPQCLRRSGQNTGAVLLAFSAGGRIASVYRGTHRFLALWPRPWLRYPPCFPARKAASSALPEARPQAENSKGPSRRPRRRMTRTAGRRLAVASRARERSQHAFGHALTAMFPLYTDAFVLLYRFTAMNARIR